MKLKVNFKSDKWVLLLVFLGGLALRLIQVGSGFWHDEAASLIISTGGPMAVLNNIKGDFHPPIFYWLLGMWLDYSGKSEVLIRLPFVFISTLVIPLTYLLTKKITDSKIAALWASIFLAVNPLHIYYSVELRMYGLATTLCILSWLLLYADDKKRNLLGYVFVTILGLFTFYGLWFSFVAQLIVLLLKKRYRWAVISLFFSLGLLMWWWPFLRVQLSGSAFMKTNLPGWAALSGDLTPKALMMIPLKWVTGRLNVSDDRSLLLSSLGALGYALFISVWSLRSKKSKDILIAIGVPLLIAILISTVAPMLGYHRYIYLIPFFCILLSVGLLSMDKNGQYLNFGALFTIFLFCNITYFMTPKYWREDWRAAGEFFRPLEDKNIVVIYTFYDAFPAAKWYLGYLPYSSVLRELKSSGNEFDKKMTSAVEGKSTVVVFDYLNDLTDKDRSVRKWLQMAGYIQKGEYVFRGVGHVYEYSPIQK